jgi:cell division protein FtsL
MARAATARKPAARSVTPRKAGTRSAAHRNGGARTSAKHRSAARQPAKRSSPRRSAASRRNGHAPATRRAPRTARSKRVAAGGATALPLPVRVMQAPVARAIRARGGKMIDALLQGQGWIALVGVLLAGIVFFNVYLLQLNRDIAVTSERAAAVKRENARLRLEVARLGSSERIQQAAAQLGLVLPAPGEVRYLRSNPSVDGRRAAKRVEAPELATAPAPMAPEPMEPEAAAPVVSEPTTDQAVTDPGATDPAAAATPPAPVTEDQAATAPTDPAAG